MNRTAAPAPVAALRAVASSVIASSVIASGVAAALLVAVLAACGDGTSSTGGGIAAGSLSPAAERGRRIASESGCQACHGRAWEGGAGPALIGLAGSTVTLRDGTTVVADRDYLIRSIADPSVEVSGTWSMKMPPNQLTDEQVADVVAFVEALAEPAGSAG